MADMVRAKILESATKCVCHDRDIQYGDPRGSFSEIAIRWSHFLSEITGKPIGLNEYDVAMMMVEFKMARITTSKGSSEDSFVDACGYLALAAELYESENKVKDDVRTDN